MIHQNLQEAIEQISADEVLNSEEIKSHFNLSKEDMMAMKPHSPLMETVTPRPVGFCTCCSCCWQSDN